jgi:four helix bundle protein
MQEATMRDHTKLRAFQLADELAIAVYKLTAAMPRQEQFGLTAQVRRAAVSCASNIVEGCARTSESDYLHFLDIAYGSAREVAYQLSLARRLGMLSEGTPCAQVEATALETGKVLNALIRSLRDRA